MRQIAAGLFVSLDGVVEAPEKWTGPYFNDQVGQAVGALMATNDAMLLGRVTYQGFAAAFGGQSGGMADQMNNTPKYVVSSTLADREAAWGPTTVLRGDVVAEVTALRAQPGGNLLVEGSAQLAQALISHGLVDEYRLMLFPIVLGAGKRLFPPAVNESSTLTLSSAKPDSDGVMLLTYHPAPDKNAAVA